MTTVWEMEGLEVSSISLDKSPFKKIYLLFPIHMNSKVEILPWVMHWGPVASPPKSVLLCEIEDIFQR